ncbi:YceD family protein [Kytococcus sp. Marseille-QA3725]
MIELDRRHPLALDLRSFGRRAGTTESGTFEVPAPEGIGTDVMTVAAGSPLGLDLRLEALVDGVLASGTVTATATGSCVRCLTELTEEVDTDFQVLYVWPGGRGEEGEEVDPETQEDVRELDGDLLDLDPAVRDAIVPTFPFQPVCSPDCPGLCDRCGALLEDDPDHAHEEIDPRWAALADLTRSDDQ